MRTLVYTLVLHLSLGCSQAPPADSTGGLVSLSPAITETLVALQAQDQLVGRSDYCTGPAEVMALPALGSGLTPNLEAVLKVHPRLVLLEGNEAADGMALSQVTSVRAFPWLTTGEISSSILAIGEVVNKAADADTLATSITEGLRSTAHAGSPRVLLVIGVDGPAGDIWYIKPNSLHGTALRAAGGRNAIDHDVQGAPSLSAERVIELDPDQIIMLGSSPMSGTKTQAAVARWAALAPLSAAKNKKISVLAGPGLMTTGPAVLSFVDQLRPMVSVAPSAPRTP
ncbi:MAG: ABC transporter substrate-binding protein [Myxococcota bacterium]